MQRCWFVSLCLGLATVCVYGQQAQSISPEPAKGSSPPQHVKVYSVGQGIIAPELLPLNLPPIPAEKCKQKLDGNVGLSLLVDEMGRSRNIMFVRPLGSDVDRFALQLAAADRFKPGAVAGKPVVVAESLNVKIRSCVVESKDGTGKKIYSLKLRSAPVQELAALVGAPEDAILTSGEGSWTNQGVSGTHVDHVGGSTKAPVPILQREADYTEAARKEKINGSCIISLIVDSQGMPQEMKVEKSVDPGLDQNALAAISGYRFKPAMRNGEPVPVRITVEMNFALY